MKPHSFAPPIYTTRDEAVVLDSDMAMIYRAETGHSNRAVKRNEARFPEDFAFRLPAAEWQILRCQIGSFRGLATLPATGETRVRWVGKGGYA